ncbi:MAG: hypothetical protein HFG28_10270 [Eubacterium sp.]|nr:hypothetical protein [Eubacterium sp.]
MFIEYVYGIWTGFKIGNIKIQIDKTTHFSVFALLMFLSAYSFMGTFSVLLPWLYEAIEEKRKNCEIRKRHYLYLLEVIKQRYNQIIVEENGDASALICSKGKITDLWNLTYILSIFVFSVLVILDVFSSGNRMDIVSVIFFEIISVITSVIMCIVPDNKERQNICLLFCIIVFILKILFCCISLGGVLYYLFIYFNQMFFNIIYWFIRYHFKDDFNFVKECRKLLNKVFVLIISEETWNYLHRNG